MLTWILTYIVIWSLYNCYFKWKIFKSGKNETLFFILFFLISSIIFDIFFYKYLSGSVLNLIFALIVSTVIGLFFSNYPPFYKHIKNGKYFLVWMPSDVFFQQGMIVTAVVLLKQYFGSGYLDLYFGLFFALIHMPILFFKWAKLRYLIVLFSFVLGLIFSYLIRTFGGVGAFSAFLMHFCIYIPIFYYLRDERIV